MGTALAGGVLALVFAVTPQSAVALCTLTIDTVTCETTTTTNTTNFPVKLSSMDRLQVFFEGAPVTAVVNSGATVNGFGLAIFNFNEEVGGINFTNAGSIMLTQVPTVGGTAALRLESIAGPITIGNSGLISSLNDLPTNVAIQATTDGSSITVSNSGSITGTVALLGGPSVFNNNLGGIWTTSGVSTFSPESTINNAGTVLATGVTTLSGGPTLQFNNLATGVISMQNGSALDRLTLSGNYVGTPGSHLVVDVDPARQAADRLIITGNASGSTTINPIYLSSGLLTSPVPIVQSASGSTATFQLANPINGLFRYSLIQPAPGTFSLSSTLTGTGFAASPVLNLASAQASQLMISGIEAQLQARRDEIQRLQCQNRPGEECTPQAGRPLAYAGDGIFSYKNEATKGNPATDALAMVTKARPAAGDLGPRPAFWAQAFDDWATFHEFGSGLNFGRTINTYGLQMGFDETWRNLVSSADALVLGIVGSYSQVNMKFDATNDNNMPNLNGPGIGLYGMYINGGFSVDTIVKGDWFNLSEFNQFDVPTSINLQNFNAAGNVQYKFWLPVKDSFIEPTAGIVYTRSQYGSGASALGLEDGYVLRLQSGARFGTAWDWNNIHFEPTFLALIYSDVTVTGTALQNIDIAAPTDEGLVRGEIDLDLHADFGHGISAYTRGEVRFGEGLLGGGIKVGARKQW
jgi:outer membrane autotransporter protein